ncbi:hypothetical protein [Negadavirga shengliensis]|uniref:Uncharacterized protein n=1 Tax=Negadavirga shengliensis TaxID=1389218 RepID=A0ABV9SZJ8_9BACT
MAKQTGILKLAGTIGNITFVQNPERVSCQAEKHAERLDVKDS